MYSTKSNLLFFPFICLVLRLSFLINILIFQQFFSFSNRMLSVTVQWKSQISCRMIYIYIYIYIDFFQGVWRGWPFLSFRPIIFFTFSPGRWFEILLSLVPGGDFFLFSFFLVPWMLVDIRLLYIYIYIQISFVKDDGTLFFSNLQVFFCRGQDRWGIIPYFLAKGFQPYF